MEVKRELDVKEEPLFVESTLPELEEHHHVSDEDLFGSFVTMECNKNVHHLDVDVKIKEEPSSAESEQLLLELQNETIPFVSHFAVESKSYITLTSGGFQIDKDIKIKKELFESEQSNVAGAEKQNVAVPSSSCVTADCEKDNVDPNIEIKEEPLFPERGSAYSEVPNSSDADAEEPGSLTGTGDDFPQAESSRLDAEALCDRYTEVSTVFTNAALENNCSTKRESCSGVDEVHENEIIPNSNNSASLLGKHDSVKKDNSAQLSHLEKNSLIDEMKPPYKCEICEQNFFQLSHLTAHRLVHNGIKVYKCVICEKIFKHQSYLRNHIYFVHEGRRRHKCDKCAKCFVSLADLKRHYLIHEGRKPHKCEVCEKSFTQASYLKTHSRMHEGIRPHRCELCEKSYMSTSDLKIHKLTHEGLKPHKCEICEKSYIRASDLRRHKLNHDGKKPYKCEICDKSFVLPSPLRRHILSHEGVKPYQCEVCDKRFTRAPHLKRHRMIHDKDVSLLK